MKIVLTLFLLALSTHALVDENIPTENAPESQKTDLIIKTNNGQTFTINADGKKSQIGTRKLESEADDEGISYGEFIDGNNQPEEPQETEAPEINDDYLDDVQYTVGKYNDQYNDQEGQEGDFCISQKLAGQVYELLNDFQAVAEEAVEEASSSSSSGASDQGNNERKLKHPLHHRRQHHKRRLRALKANKHRRLARGQRHHRRHHRTLKEETLKNKVSGKSERARSLVASN